MARLSEVITETPTIKTFVFDLGEPLKFRAGQFVQLGVLGLGEAPFTPSSSPLEPSRLEVTVLKTGRVTDHMHTMKAGETMMLRGPFGKGYPIEKLEGKEVLVVGGGVGLAPLRSLIWMLLSMTRRGGPKKVSIKYGARESAELLYKNQYDQWQGHDKVDFTCSIDRPEPGWTGNVGVVTTLLDNLDIDIPNSLAFSCGPGIMLKFVTQKLLETGFKPAQIYLSMNRRMSCGIGKCGRCNIGPYYLCKDGPDICYEKIMGYDNVF